MSMTLEERVAALEREIAKSRRLDAGSTAKELPGSAGGGGASPAEHLDPELAMLAASGVKVRVRKGWLKTFGRAKDDPHFEEAMRLGAAWRAEENRRSIEEADAGS